MNKSVKNPSNINSLIPIQLLNKFSYSPVKIRIPINIIKFGNVGNRFQKDFKGYGNYKGRLIEIRSNMKGNKDRRCMYSDGNIEDLSLKDLKKFKNLKFLTPVKKVESVKILEKIEIKSPVVKVLNKYSLCICGNIGFTFIKKFKGFGFYQGVVIEIKRDAKNKKDRRVLYTDGDMEDLSLKQLSSLHTRNNHLLLAPNTLPTCDDEKSHPNVEFLVENSLETPQFPFMSPSSPSPSPSPSSSLPKTTDTPLHTPEQDNNEDSPPSKNESYSNLKGESIVFLSQNVHSLRSESQRLYLDIIVELMSFRKIDVYLIQETWLDGDYVSEIKGYTLFRYGLKKKCGRGQCGVGIILSPTFLQFYKDSGSKPPITVSDENAIGRFIGLELTIKVKTDHKGAFKKKKRKNKFQSLNLFISSVYHPVDKEDQLLFYNHLSSIYAAIPTNCLLFSGQDLNANLGTKKNSKLKCIGSYGLNNRNAKGKEAINILNLHNLYAPSTFFKHKNYTTWKYFDGHNRPYQLEQWICSSLNHIEDANVVSYGIPSDHSAIKLKLKFKIFEKKKSETVKNNQLETFIRRGYQEEIQLFAIKKFGKI